MPEGLDEWGFLLLLGTTAGSAEELCGTYALRRPLTFRGGGELGVMARDVQELMLDDVGQQMGHNTNLING